MECFYRDRAGSWVLQSYASESFFPPTLLAIAAVFTMWKRKPKKHDKILSKWLLQYLSLYRFQVSILKYNQTLELNETATLHQ